MKISIQQKACLLLSFFVIVTGMTKAQTYKTIDQLKGISVGAKVPMFTTVDVVGKPYKLKDALKKGPVVILFYRGQWCPICNRYLSSLQDSVQQIYAKGATVIAISPERPEMLAKTKEKTKASFTLLHDRDFLIGNAFDVVFMPDQKVVSLYNTRLNAHLEQASSDGTARLPVPATFIVDQKGIVVWKQFNPDYKIRASAKEILNHIPNK